jgi:hypothetical protein
VSIFFRPVGPMADGAEAEVPHLTWEMVNRFRNYPDPVTIEVTHTGLSRTHPSVVEEELATVRAAATIPEYLALASDARNRWSNLGLFNRIGFEIAPHPDPTVTKGFLAIARFVEAAAWSWVARLHIHKESLFPCLQISRDGLFGRPYCAQTFGSWAGVGRHLFGVRLGRRGLWDSGEAWLSVWQRSRPASDPPLGCDETVRQIQAYFNTPYRGGWGHQITAFLEQRLLGEANGDVEVVPEARRSWKAALRHIWHSNSVVEVVNPLTEDFGMPVGGGSTEFDSELSVIMADGRSNGIGKFEFHSCRFRPVLSDHDWTMHVNREARGDGLPIDAAAGSEDDATASIEQPQRYLILGLFTRLGWMLSTEGHVPMSERFFMGDNYIRGFKGVGPGIPFPTSATEDAPLLTQVPRQTGGTTLASACVDLMLPLPDLLPDGLAFAHVFANTGNVADAPLTGSDRVQWLQNFVLNARSSVGCGIVFGYLPLLGHLGRLEANVSFPLNAFGRPYRPHEACPLFQQYKIGLTWTTNGVVGLYPPFQ